MKIVSWNCGGWSCGGFNNDQLGLLLKNDPEIIVVQESMKNEHENIKYQFKYKDWYGDDKEESYKGISIFSNISKIRISENFNAKFRYVVPYKIMEKIILLAIWTKKPFNGSDNYQKTIFDALDYYKFKEPIIIVGDFNTGSNETYVDRYNELCNELGRYNLKNCAKDTCFEYEYTFYHDRQKKFYTNDFCFISNDLEIDYINIPSKSEWEEISENKIRWKKLSDHCPIEVNIKI
jgi:exonuclease III